MITIWWIVSNHLAHDIVKESPNQMISYHSLCVCTCLNSMLLKVTSLPPLIFYRDDTQKHNYKLRAAVSRIFTCSTKILLLQMLPYLECTVWGWIFTIFFFTFLARKCFLPLTTCENVFANDAYFCLIDTRKTTTAELEKFALNDQSNWKLFSKKCKLKSRFRQYRDQ